MSVHHLTEDYGNIVGQIWIALGRGIGSLDVSAGAVALLDQHYRGKSRQFMAQWDQASDAILTYSYDLGTACAQDAANSESTVIEESHVRQVVENFQPCMCGYHA